MLNVVRLEGVIYPQACVGLSDGRVPCPQIRTVILWGEAIVPWGEAICLGAIPWGEAMQNY
jgi:hypothetical protein